MEQEPKFKARDIINAIEHPLHDKYDIVRDVTDLYCQNLQVVLDEFEKFSSGAAGDRVDFA